MRSPTAPLSIGLSVGLAIGLFVVSVTTLPAGSAQSREPDRKLRLYFGHTGERGEFTFKRNGRYDRGELRRINHFLRDWRKGEDAKMDPQLLDLIWAIYRESGSRDYIHVISAYRSPATNEMLRSRSSGVAKNSQHRLGKAMDFYIPDVPLAKLRGVAMKMQGGGVGYYPRSGSPFVHVDTGNVRAWPRMTRSQLLALFPNGNTLHLPADGKPLPGYDTAVARRQSSSGTVLAYVDTETAEAEDTDRTGTGGGWLKRVFAGGSRDDAAPAEAEVALPAPPPASGDPQMLVAAGEEESAPRMPRARPESQMEVALAALDPASGDEGAETLELPSVPRSRPEESALFAEGLENGYGNAEDAIALLAARMDVLETPPAAPPAQDPIELAFAAVEGTLLPPSEADRAILAAFAALDEGSVREADATLAAAVALRAAGGEATGEESAPREPSPIVIAASFSPVTPARAAEADEAGDDSGFVLAPDGLSLYEEDEDSLVELIGTTVAADPTQPQLEMPSPESALYEAPEGVAEVAGFRGESGPPVDGFVRASASRAPATGGADDGGFFSKLFATLIE